MDEGRLPGPIGEDDGDGASDARIEPVMAAIRDVAARIMAQPAVASDTECRHLMFLLALSETPEEFDDVSDRLQARVRALTDPAAAAPPEPAAPPSRPTRVLFRL